MLENLCLVFMTIDPIANTSFSALNDEFPGLKHLICRFIHDDELKMNQYRQNRAKRYGILGVSLPDFSVLRMSIPITK